MYRNRNMALTLVALTGMFTMYNVETDELQEALMINYILQRCAGVCVASQLDGQFVRSAPRDSAATHNMMYAAPR